MKKLLFILIMLILPVTVKADDLTLYKTENLSFDNCRTFTGLAGYQELNKVNNTSDNVPSELPGCEPSHFTYMDYKKVTSVNSAQYKVLNSPNAWTDPSTGLRFYEDRICIAIGTGFDCPAGTFVDIKLSNDAIIKCIVGDIKSDEHTDETHRFHTIDGSVVEMITDDTYFTGPEMYPDFLKDTSVIRIVNVNKE